MAAVRSRVVLSQRDMEVNGGFVDIEHSPPLPGILTLRTLPQLVSIPMTQRCRVWYPARECPCGSVEVLWQT